MNGQRPNSNNMTIDGVANIDTGDNGGNMATTNIDAVAEFKILTNAYQAEYGRAVGGQIQVVTKSGTQAFHGSGYWYGRRSDWNANSWTNKRAAAPPPVGNGALIEPPRRSRNDYGYTLGGPDLHPGRLQRGQEEALLLLEPGVPAPHRPGRPSGRARVPTALERAGDFSQSVDSSGNPFPYIRDYTTGPALQRGATPRGCFQDGGVLGQDPREPPLRSRASPRSTSSRRRTSRRAAASTTRARPRPTTPRREDLLRLDFQATDKWRFTGRYMKTKDDISPGLRHHLGRQRQRPASTMPVALRCTPARTGCSRPPAS